jgi:hypothetical protein
MAIAQLGVLDLSVVTDALIARLTDCRDSSPLWPGPNPQPSFTINVTGKAPDTVRSGADCELSLYLFHVTQDKFQMNAPVVGPRAMTIPFQPLSLDLFYLLSAYAGSDYVHEQQAMSIALRCFHETPILRTTVPFGAGPIQEEFTLTMEVETADEIGRLWQATTVALRLATVWKVSVVFMPPEAPTRPIAPPPTRVSLGADAASLPFAALGQVSGTRRTVTYPYPSGTPAGSMLATFELSPATVGPGQRMSLTGAGLNQPTSRRIYLVAPDGSEQEVTSWKAADPGPPGSVLQTSSVMTVDLPPAAGNAPLATPAAGTYQLRVGSDVAAGDPQTYRSSGTPFNIAAAIHVTADPPILVPAAGVYSLAGVGFAVGATELFLETSALVATGGPPAAGEFRVNAAGTALTFRLPAGLEPGRYGVRVRTNQVESDPSWWIDVP